MKKILLIPAFICVAFLVDCSTTKNTPSPMSITDAPAVMDAAAIAAENVAGKTPELSPAQLNGKGLYESSCARCHKLFDPKEYSQQEWQPILTRMQRKARLSDEEMADIHSYINFYAM